MAVMWRTRGLLVAMVIAIAAASAYAAAPKRKLMPVPSPGLVPPRPPSPSKHFRRGIEPSYSIYAPAFLPTPLPPLDAHPPLREHKLEQPRKPVYHYTPIKPFSDEEVRQMYNGKGKNFDNSRYGLAGESENFFGPVLGEEQKDGPQVYELNTEPPPLQQPIFPSRPIVVPELPVQDVEALQLQVALPVQNEFAGALIPDTELLDIKTIRLGEAVGLGQIGSDVVQRQNPAHSKYHFEYRVRDHEGEFGHAEAKDGPLTTGGYDVNLHEAHVQSVRYFVDSKEIGHQQFLHA